MNNYSGELKKHGFEGKIFLCYALGDLPEVQRIVYDLEKELGFSCPDSPTSRVGDIVLEGFKKHKHEVPLLLILNPNMKNHLGT